MAWVYLFLAGLMEVAWAIALKYSQQFTQLIPTLIFAVTAPASVILLAYSLKGIPLGTAYSIWTGFGAAGVAILGMIFLNDPVTFFRIFFICLIITGVVGLKLSSGG